jgi:hypothetical protein
MTAGDFDRLHGKSKVEEEEEDEGSNSIVKDMTFALQLCAILKRWRASDTDSLFSWSEPLLGSDITFVAGGIAIPAHLVILSLRVPAFGQLMSSGKVGRLVVRKSDPSMIEVDVCHPLVMLLLLQYVYSDDVAAIWDSRVARIILAKFADLKLLIGDIKADLKALADSLDLAPLSAVLSSAGKTTIPRRTLPHDLQAFFVKTSSQPSSNACDIVLVLADKIVACSSVILRARCPFFEAMFADSDWTVARHGEGKVTIRMEHLRWTPMKLVFKFIHEGLEDDLFDYLREYFGRRYVRLADCC